MHKLLVDKISKNIIYLYVAAAVEQTDRTLEIVEAVDSRTDEAPLLKKCM